MGLPNSASPYCKGQVAMRAYNGDPDAFVSDNSETLVRLH